MSATWLVALVSLAPSLAAYANETLMDELERRLDAGGVAGVNAHLSANWESDMARLGDLTEACDRRALRLSLALMNTRNVEALQGHSHALEIAMGRCPTRLLPLVPAMHVARLCGVASYEEMHLTSDVIGEIDRRVMRLQASKQAARSPNWRACVDAYRAARVMRQYP